MTGELCTYCGSCIYLESENVADRIEHYGCCEICGGSISITEYCSKPKSRYNNPTRIWHEPKEVDITDIINTIKNVNPSFHPSCSDKFRKTKSTPGFMITRIDEDRVYGYCGKRMQ